MFFLRTRCQDPERELPSEVQMSPVKPQELVGGGGGISNLGTAAVGRKENAAGREDRGPRNRTQSLSGQLCHLELPGGSPQPQAECLKPQSSLGRTGTTSVIHHKPLSAPPEIMLIRGFFGEFGVFGPGGA